MSGAIADVAAAITESIARLGRARAGCAAAANAAGRARDQFRSSAGTSRNPHAVAMIQRTALAAQRLHEGDQTLSEAVRLIEEYAARLGVDVTRVVQSSVSMPPSSSSKGLSSPGGADAAPGRVPAFVTGIVAELRSMLPRGTKVVGVMTAPDGGNRSAPIWSGVDGPAAGAPGLRADDQVPWHQLKTVLEHVEGHVAAIMRHPGAPRHAVLVISESPCERRPFGCDRVLPALLPQGATLTVYVGDEDGSARLWKTYTGTGRGVAP